MFDEHDFSGYSWRMGVPLPKNYQGEGRSKTVVHKREYSRLGMWQLNDCALGWNLTYFCGSIFQNHRNS